jgi:hypothetical protein
MRGQVSPTLGWATRECERDSISVVVALSLCNCLRSWADKMTAVYNGDVTLAPSTSSVLLQVVAQATGTPALTSSPNPSTVGQTVTFTGACGSVASDSRFGTGPAARPLFP